VNPRAGLDDVEKILDPTGTPQLRLLGRPARSQSLYRLGYLCSLVLFCQLNFHQLVGTMGSNGPTCGPVPTTSGRNKYTADRLGKWEAHTLRILKVPD
jgi:hypothetical protein